MSTLDKDDKKRANSILKQDGSFYSNSILFTMLILLCRSKTSLFKVIVISYESRGIYCFIVRIFEIIYISS